MRLAELMRFAWLHPRPREPPLRQFEEDDRFRFVDFEEHGGVDVDADQHHTGVVGSAVARIALLPNHAFQSGSYSS